MICSFGQTEQKEEKESLDNSISDEKIDLINDMLSKKKELEIEEEKLNTSTFSAQNLSKIEFDPGNNNQCSMSKGSCLSREDECIQKDVLKEMDISSKLKESISATNNMNSEDKIIDLSNDSSTNSRHSKNYILKSSLVGKKEGNALHQHHHDVKENLLTNNGKFASYLLEADCFQGNNSKAFDDQLGFNIDNNSNTNNMNINQIDNNYNFNLQPLPFTYVPTYEEQEYFPNNINRNKMNNYSHNQSSMNSSSITYQPNTLAFINKYQFNPNKLSSKNSNQTLSPPRNTSIDNSTIDELIQSCVIKCQEQTGCRFLQTKIDEYPKLASEMLMVIKDKFCDLSCHTFGNYFIQKIIDYLSVPELDEIMRGDLSTYFKKICLNPFGTRVIQKFLEKIMINDSLLNMFHILLKPNIMEFAFSPHANHILIRYVQWIDSPKNDFIINEFNLKIVEVATHKHSCSALQKCIENSNVTQKKMLLLSIAKNADTLFTDSNGNFVVQYALEQKDKEVNDIIMNSYLYDFPKYSNMKYSSSVFEKCIDHCEIEMREMIVERLCNPKIVENLLFSTYGNFVLQKTMKIAKEPYRTNYLNMVKPLINQVKEGICAPKIISKILTAFPELVQYSNTRGSNSNVNVIGSNNNNSNVNRNSNMNLNNSNNMTIGNSVIGVNGIISAGNNVSLNNSYGNIYYQNNHIYNQMCFPNQNMNNQYSMNINGGNQYDQAVKYYPQQQQFQQHQLQQQKQSSTYYKGHHNLYN